MPTVRTGFDYNLMRGLVVVRRPRESSEGALSAADDEAQHNPQKCVALCSVAVHVQAAAVARGMT